MIIINDTLGVRGGTMTLMYRMCKWYRNRGIEVSVLYEADGNDEVKKKIEDLGVRTISVGFFDLNRIKKAIESLKVNNNEIKVINFNLNHYLDIEYVRKRYGIDIKNIMYVIHPDCLKKGLNIRNGIIRNIYKNYYYRLVTKMINLNAMVFMDNDTINATKVHYQRPFQDELMIIPLPIDILKIEDWENVIQTGFRSNTVLTASRADFPFKGYLLGLIDCFVKLKKEHPDVRLRIFSDGEDINQLRNKIHSVDTNYRDSIELYGWIDYEGLNEELKKCHVFIGMATGLLDSSKNYKISIPVKHSTNNCVSCSFFYEYPMLLVEEYREDMTDKTMELLSKTFHFSYDEYRNVSLSSFKAVNDLYNEDAVMSKLTDVFKTNNKPSMNTLQCIFHGMYQSINKIRFKSIS